MINKLQQKILLIALLVLGAYSVEAQTVLMSAEKQAEYRECIGLNYSMPDYSTSRVNSKMMGMRLAKIVDKILDMSKMEANLNRFAVMQVQQIISETVKHGSVRRAKVPLLTRPLQTRIN